MKTSRRLFLRTAAFAGVGFRCWGSQAMYVENLLVHAHGAYAGIQDVIGNAGYMANIEVRGGKYGILAKEGQTGSIAGCTLLDQEDAAIAQEMFHFPQGNRAQTHLRLRAEESSGGFRQGERFAGQPQPDPRVQQVAHPSPLLPRRLVQVHGQRRPARCRADEWAQPTPWRQARHGLPLCA